MNSIKIILTLIVSVWSIQSQSSTTYIDVITSISPVRDYWMQQQQKLGNLIDFGDINFVNENNHTALMIAVQDDQDNTATVSWLLSFSPNLLLKDRQGYTVFRLLIEKRKQEPMSYHKKISNLLRNHFFLFLKPCLEANLKSMEIPTREENKTYRGEIILNLKSIEEEEEEELICIESKNRGRINFQPLASLLRQIRTLSPNSIKIFPEQ